MKKFLTSKEAADYLGVPEPELQEIVQKGKLPAYKIGGVYTRFRLDDLNSYGRRFPKRPGHAQMASVSDRIKDFFYFNDFYIYSSAAIIIILYFIFR